MTAEVVTEISESRWLEFLKSTHDANIFQSPQMMRVYRAARGYKPRVFAVESRGEVRAIMMSSLITFGSKRLARLVTRSICIGGPIGDPTQLPNLLSAYDATTSKFAVLSQIRNLRTALEKSAFESAGYTWADHKNYLVDLEDGEDAVLARISKSKRKGIAKVERSGVQLVDLGPSAIGAGYGLLEQTYARARVPLADRSLFEGAYEQLQPQGLMWAVAGLLNGTPCSVRFVLRWGDALYDWYAGSSDVGRSVRADEWVVWQVLRRGIAAGCKTFDFGGAGAPDEPYGPGQFKREFGGREINPGRFEKSYRPIAWRLSKVAYKAWRAFAMMRSSQTRRGIRGAGSN